MRINRQRSSLSFRSRNRRSGCLSFAMPLLLIGALLFFTRGVWGSWLRDLRVAAPSQPTIEDVEAAVARGDVATASEIGLQLLGENPDDLDVLAQTVRALVYYSYNEYNLDTNRARALELAQQAVEKFPEDPVALAVYAYAQQANGIRDEASITALRAIRRDQNNIMARLALSLSYGQRGIFAAAEREGLRAVEIAMQFAPSWRADAYRVLAIAYGDLGRYEDAQRAADRAISYNHRLLPLHFERALFASQVGDMDTATAHYFNIIALDNENVKARLRLCSVSSLLGERDAAIEYCKQVTDRAPGWAEGWYYLGREYFLKGDWPKTRDAMGRCSGLQVAQGIRIEDRRFECWYLQGQAAEVLGDCPTLLRIYDEFQKMKAVAEIEETWAYPADGPPGCQPTPAAT